MRRKDKKKAPAKRNKIPTNTPTTIPPISAGLSPEVSEIVTVVTLLFDTVDVGTKVVEISVGTGDRRGGVTQTSVKNGTSSLRKLVEEDNGVRIILVSQ